MNLQRLVNDSPTIVKFRDRLANNQIYMGNLLKDAGSPVEAVAFLRAGQANFQHLVDQSPAATDFLGSLAISHNDLGWALFDSGQETESEHRKALAIYQKLADDNPADTDLRSRLATRHNDLGWLLVNISKPSEAESEHRKALAIHQKLADDNPKEPAYRCETAYANYGLSVALRRLGRPAEARDHSERAVAACEALVAEDPKDGAFCARPAESCLRRGLDRRALGDLAGAATDFRLALKWRDEQRLLANFENFGTATFHAALVGVAGQAGSGVSVDERTTEAETAMTQLRKAVAMNYRSAAFRTEDALDPLRGREDFKLLMLDVAFPAEPFAGAE
jgi:tetratricopeptide (TPR) repeat protein